MSPFIPMVGTEYEGKSSPSADWIWDVHEKASGIIHKNLPEAFSEEVWNGDIGICPSCTTTKLFFDFFRRIVPRENPRRILSPHSTQAFINVSPLPDLYVQDIRIRFRHMLNIGYLYSNLTTE